MAINLHQYNYSHFEIIFHLLQVHIVLREGEVLEIPDFDDIYDSDLVSETCYMLRAVREDLNTAGGGGRGGGRGGVL